MCPDPQLLSVYCDGELPSPWKEKMENHLAQCQECRNRLENYRLLSGAGRDKTASAAAEAAQERVWKKLETKCGINAQAAAAGQTAMSVGNPLAQAGSPNRYINGSRRSAFWSRRISVPIPAAAAILIIIAIALLWAGQSKDNNAAVNMTVASEEYSLWPPAMDFDNQGKVPATDLSGVLQYLSSRDSGDIVQLRLPETRSFFSSGKPAIIRAADYSRRKR